MNNQVSLNYLDSYDVGKIERAFSKSLEQLEGANIFHPNMRVLLKVCLPNGKNPDDAECTNPKVIEGIVKSLTKLGVKCIIADSPYGSISTSSYDKIYYNANLLEVANNTDCELNNDLSTFILELPNGEIVKKVDVLDIINNVDAIINVGKLKIDEKLQYFGASANLFGLVAGDEKKQIVARLRNVKEFNDLCLDLYDGIKKKICLNVIDGIVALNGKKNQHILYCLGVGKNSFALDLSMMNILDIDNERTIINQAKNRGFIEKDFNVELVNEDYSKFKVDNLNIENLDENKVINKHKINNKIYYLLNQERPKIKCKTCKGCSICSKICPTGAIKMKYDKNNELFADIDYRKCIYCNKCITACPYNVVKLNRPIGARLLKHDINRYNEEKNIN